MFMCYLNMYIAVFKGGAKNVLFVKVVVVMQRQ